MYEPHEICGDCEQDPCECDAIALANMMDPADWSDSDVMRVARRDGYTVAEVERAIEILNERNEDYAERRELAEYNHSHRAGAL